MSRRKSAGFNRSAIKASGESWEDVRRFNAALRSLQKCRKTKVERTGHLAASKIAWKAAVLQQALLYRVIELGAGCAKMWNLGNVLCSVIAARALLETIALILDFEAKLQSHAAANNFEAMDSLITSNTFATRSDDLIAEHPELEAKNVLTYIDRLGKKVPGIRTHYLHLCEWSHPNGIGHYFTFGTLDHETGTVAFSTKKLYDKNLLNHVLAVYLMIGLIVSAMERLDALIIRISEAHSVAFPLDRQ
jgi:hypothetical protein